jgi:ABC-2 type transport system ATP-binding protein
MPADNAPALVLRRLTKSFGRRAVDRLDLTIGAGEFYALLGPNGAGKTTTLRLTAAREVRLVALPFPCQGALAP